MEQEKITILTNRLKEDHFVYFRLYNATYYIKFENQLFTIKQEGIIITYEYQTLKQLFENYKVYGSPLINEIKDIKII